MTTETQVARIASALADTDRAIWIRAPGRVNLMGDHTDYNEGFVLPAAIDRECVLAVRPNGSGRVRIRSLDVPADRASVDIAADGSDVPAEVTPAWGRYVAGVTRALAERGRPPVGLDGVLSSTVPPGSGLSSSAAVEVACAAALAVVAEAELTPLELALACQRAEHMATGVRSGIMDQLSSAAGVEGAALLIDCRTLGAEPVPVPEALALLAVHSGVERTLEATAYAERRAACEETASRLGVPALRDATIEQVGDDPFARHVVTENERVLATARALAAGDVTALSALFAESHASLRDDYRVSTSELDLLVDALVEAGAVGARLTGAGFGGCAVALCKRAGVVAVGEAATARYRAETGLEAAAFLCRPVRGAGRLRPRF